MSKRKSLSPLDLRGRSAVLRREFEEKLASLVEIPSVSMDPGRRAEVEKVGAPRLRSPARAGAQAEYIETGGTALGVRTPHPRFQIILR